MNVYYCYLDSVVPESANDTFINNIYFMEVLKSLIINRNMRMGLNDLLQASAKGVNFLVSKLDENGQFSIPEARDDLCTVYKLPMLLLMSGREKLANLVLDDIKKRFMQPNGDFISYESKTGSESKTVNGALAHFWSYMNGWVAMAAHRAGRFDISFPAFNYMKSFYNPEMKSVNCSEPYDKVNKGNGQEVDLLMNSHLGLVSLYFGDIELSETLGDSIKEFVDQQPNLQVEFLIRKSTDSGTFMQTGPEELSPFYSVKVKEPNQLYFLLGYPVIFLTKLYITTKIDKYLNTAKNILDFLLTCDKTMYTFSYSHKVAYGSALVAKETKIIKYKEMSQDIAQFLVSLQSEEGDFLKSASVLDNFDQTAELSLWLQGINVELSRF